MHGAFEGGGVFVGVAGEAERLRARSDELDVGDVFIDPNFVTAQTSRGNGGMDGLSFRLVLVALQALLGVDVLFERNWMLLGEPRQDSNQNKERHLSKTGDDASYGSYSIQDQAA
jgi:hypothetical protein